MSIVPMTGMAISAPTEQQRELVADDGQMRRMSQASGHVGIRQRLWGINARTDPTVTFEEYTYWAKIERELEKEENRKYQERMKSVGIMGQLKAYWSTNPYEDGKDPNEIARRVEEYEEKTKNLRTSSDGSEKATAVGADGMVRPVSPEGSNRGDLDEDWRVAARALRVAGWGTIFYLITTDILGWGATPYVFASDGYGLAVGLFVLFGLAAGASGWMIWRTFIELDSSRFPMMSYGDPFLRLYGPWMRHAINVGQSFQQFMTVAVIIISNGQIFNQLISEKICYIVCFIIPLIFGVASGIMRSLKHLGWFCNLSVWLNVISFIIICAAAAKNGPDVTTAIKATRFYLGVPAYHAGATDPSKAPAVKTFVAPPPPFYQQTTPNEFAARFNGIDSMVYSFSGAILFVAFLNEMRHPMDFWKAMVCAQTFITVVYVFFGAFVYTYYGQYSYSLINQIVSPVDLQIVGNVFTLVTALLAVFLYFNVGFKTVYLEVGQELLNFPPITTKKGKMLWYTLGPVYWILAFVVAASLPEFEAFVNFVGALFSLNFTYTFSGWMYGAYVVHEGARLPGEGFDPHTGVTTRHDEGMKRIMRGIRKKIYIVLPVVIFSCLGLAASGMGTWSAILGLVAAIKYSAATSWSCTTPN